MTHQDAHQIITTFWACFFGSILGVLLCFPMFKALDYFLDKVFKK